MGQAMKFPIGIQEFDKIINGGYVYVDKTALIYRLVTEGSIYFLSRPRRFGKSLLVSTLEAYFKGKKDLFRGLAIDELEKEWAEYPVFHIDFNGGNFTQPGVLEEKIEDALRGWEQLYGTSPNYTSTGNRFQYVLKAAHEKYGRRSVVLIDEYDKPLLDVLDTGILIDVNGQERLLEDHHRNILKGFYSVFKAADADLQFVLLTGVTKFSQVSVFSGFNQPKDISMDGRYEALCGITEEELYQYFATPIERLAAKYRYNIDQMKDKLGDSAILLASAFDGSGSQVGYVITVTTHEGYGGDIQFTMGVRNDGTLNGISILSISETAGLGMRAGEVLVPQFAEKQVEAFVTSKTGASTPEQIDAISGATITTDAFVNGVNAGMACFREYLSEGGNLNE